MDQKQHPVYGVESKYLPSSLKGCHTQLQAPLKHSKDHLLVLYGRIRQYLLLLPLCNSMAHAISILQTSSHFNNIVCALCKSHRILSHSVYSTIYTAA